MYSRAQTPLYFMPLLTCVLVCVFVLLLLLCVCVRAQSWPAEFVSVPPATGFQGRHGLI
jgi:hypothetical protein